MCVRTKNYFFWNKLSLSGRWETRGHAYPPRSSHRIARMTSVLRLIFSHRKVSCGHSFLPQLSQGCCRPQLHALNRTDFYQMSKSKFSLCLWSQFLLGFCNECFLNLGWMKKSHLVHSPQALFFCLSKSHLPWGEIPAPDPPHQLCPSCQSCTLLFLHVCLVRKKQNRLQNLHLSSSWGNDMWYDWITPVHLCVLSGVSGVQPDSETDRRSSQTDTWHKTLFFLPDYLPRFHVCDALNNRARTEIQLSCPWSSAQLWSWEHPVAQSRNHGSRHHIFWLCHIASPVGTCLSKW